MIKLNTFESLQSLGAKSFVIYFAKKNIKLKIYRINIGSCFVLVTKTRLTYFWRN